MVLRNLAMVAGLYKVTIEESVEIVSFNPGIPNDNVVLCSFFPLLHVKSTPL